MKTNCKYIIHFLSLILLGSLFSCGSESEVAGLPGNGQAGSLARFSIANDYLYLLNGEKLDIYNVQDAANPTAENSVEVGFGIETIFISQNNLFIGSQTGMHIYDITNRKEPAWLSTYNHVTACDPVVVQGQYAYVTIRDGVDCRFGDNLLDVVDISELTAPRVVASYPMSNPHGLGIDGASLFVCEGDFGLKTFDASKPPSLVEKEHITDFHGYDVIPNNGNLIVIGKDGLYQYNYANQEGLNFLSKITVQ